MPNASGGDDYQQALSSLYGDSVGPFGMPFGLDACTFASWIVTLVAAGAMVAAFVVAAVDNPGGGRGNSSGGGSSDTIERPDFEFDFSDFNDLLNESRNRNNE
jgi:hypothetical protein